MGFNSELKIQNIIRIDSNNYITLKKAAKLIPDTLFEDTEHRFEPLGIYKIIVDDNVFMDESFFDSIIDMWVYLITAVDDLLNGEFAEVCFFDQPISFIIKPLFNNQIKIILDPCVEPIRSTVISKKSFLQEVARAGDEFFRIWVDYDPACTEADVSAYFDCIERFKKAADEIY